MGDDFRALRAESQERRARNRESGAKALAEAGFPFESKNSGAHLIIKKTLTKCWDLVVTVDYWPGTGRWMARGVSNNGRGIFSLLKYLRGRG